MKIEFLIKAYVAFFSVSTSVVASTKATLVDGIFNGLLKYQPGFNGTTYAVPQENYLYEDFLIQTPGIWG